MPTLIRELLWDDWNEEHIARHHVSPSEVEEVCFSDPWFLRARGKDKRAVYGQTQGGRYLFVILGGRGSGIFYPVTARDMTEAERQRYRYHRRSQ
ncbi:MAG: hypothetical protein Q7O66_11060 [Dehalococcoidia bacterium]|nr:hypothetical protein [Dehalococcoidia bacterium]